MWKWLLQGMWVVFILGQTIRWNHTGFVWPTILSSPMSFIRRWKFTLVTEHGISLFDKWIICIWYFSFYCADWSGWFCKYSVNYWCFGLFVLYNAAASQSVSCWTCSVPFSRLCWLFTPDHTQQSTLVLKWIGKMYDLFFVNLLFISIWCVNIFFLIVLQKMLEKYWVYVSDLL